MKSMLMRICGVLFLALGAIGAFLPVLPTTPFVLVGVGCLGSSSPKLLGRLEGTRYFGEFIHNYRQKKGISHRTRVMALCWLWGTLCISAVIAASLRVSLVLLCVGIGVSVHILTIAVKKQES